MSGLKQLGIIVLFAALLAGGYAGYAAYVAPGQAGGDAARGGARQAPAVEVAAAGLHLLETGLEAVGTTFALRAVEIVPAASGRVVALDFRSGQHVAAGDVLARLDDDIERADLAEAEARLDEAELALERARTLSQTNTISQASLEQLRSARTAARAGVDRALRRFADRTVIAPFAGIVGLRRVEVGARVDGDTLITTLDDLSRIEIEFALPETVFGRVSPGLRVSADSAAFPGRAFAGEIVAIDSRIDPSSRSFKVRAVVPNADLALPAGMFMHLSLILDSGMALTVPEEAVIVEAGRTYLFVVEDDVAHRRDVRLGRREAGSVEITDGLGEGELIVVRGVQNLRDGVAVRAIGADAAPAAAPDDAGAGAPPARG